MSTEILDVPCDTCGKPVHLPHDPPRACGVVLCWEHDCDCAVCLLTEVTC